jgi:hypothetical protein
MVFKKEIVKEKGIKEEKQREVLRRRLELIIKAFLLFRQNNYDYIRDYTLKPHRQKRLQKFVQEKMDEFYSQGEASIVFYCFEFVVSKKKDRPKNNKLILLYDFQFFIRFIRYKDNREMIRKIKKLGKDFFPLKRLIQKRF